MLLVLPENIHIHYNEEIDVEFTSHDSVDYGLLLPSGEYQLMSIADDGDTQLFYFSYMGTNTRYKMYYPQLLAISKLLLSWKPEVNTIDLTSL